MHNKHYKRFINLISVTHLKNVVVRIKTIILLLINYQFPLEY